jgi:sucrose-phosphate synthase
MATPTRGLYLAHISIHGLIRADNLELGRDADTGGQTKYVIELAGALAQHDDVERVDLMTRQIIDDRVDDDYAKEIEWLGDDAYIVRVPCGPPRYIRKELLWRHLDYYVDNLLPHFRRIGRLPDAIHAHYADAGYVAAGLSALLDVPMIYTGHSLGRVKLQRLLDRGLKRERIEKNYHISTRIEAEETALDHASLVIASTKQEIDEQYGMYDNHHPERMMVNPPGVDLSRFSAPKKKAPPAAIEPAITRFLDDPAKPAILALARADPRKNLPALVEAFGKTEGLRDAANLILVAGNRDDIDDLERDARDELSKILRLIDKYDLYGHIAYPKHHKPDDVADIYRFAAKTGGVFVNPALTEPFGLTLLEAAATGLPVVATNDGGPRDILDVCKSGTLIDPYDVDGIGRRLLEVMTDRKQRQTWSDNGLANVEHFDWHHHVERYVTALRERTRADRRRQGIVAIRDGALSQVDRALIVDIDGTLLGDDDAVNELVQRVHDHPTAGFGVATGRHLASAAQALEDAGVPAPDVWVTSVGSEINYGPRHQPETQWQKHLRYRWRPRRIREAVASLGDRIWLQPDENQREFKISYTLDPATGMSASQVRRVLREHNLPAKVIFSHGQYLDILPVRASKGKAIRWLAHRWGIPLDNIMTAGDSGNDEDMLTGAMIGVVVGNHSDELGKLRGYERVYFAEGHCAAGILEAVDAMDFFGKIHAPKDATAESAG